jgi:hypothetical protein
MRFDGAYLVNLALLHRYLQYRHRPFDCRSGDVPDF